MTKNQKQNKTKNIPAVKRFHQSQLNYSPVRK